MEPCCVTEPKFYKSRGCWLYCHLGANIQPGVVGVGGKVAMTEKKRKLAADDPQGDTGG